ncbi:MAG: PQQ-binding-like beta-propeller repeat protein [Deltaproteobacteria bacterium]|nr:PQQ-binding-like beta-propeller repeat protein [Deltaproteobacteria bacterium]
MNIALNRLVLTAVIASAVNVSLVAAWAGGDTGVPDISRSSGGLVVCVASGGETEIVSLAALAKEGNWTVQVLVDDARMCKNVRALISPQQGNGRFTIRTFNGKNLPYVSGLVNHIICGSNSRVPRAEVMRVLAPRGTAYFSKAGTWEKVVKPVPENIDDWPMCLYAPDNNAVSSDLVVGPPKHLQWQSGPTWSRSHEMMSSLNAMVSMNGLLFYTIDEGSRMSPVLPEKWKLIARDAFNGVVLWKRALPSWHTHIWPLKSGPAQVQRRLVADDDSVYLPLGAGEALSRLSAATGKTIQTLADTEGVEEILISNGVLFLLVGDTIVEQQKFNLTTTKVWGAASNATSQFAWDDRKRSIMAIDKKNGEILWKEDYPVLPMTLGVDDRKVCFHDGTRVIALNRADGTLLWSSEPVEVKKYKLGTATAPSVVLYEDVVLCTQGFDFKDGLVYAFSGKTGDTLWSGKHSASGHSSQDDLFVIDGLVWAGAISQINKQGGVYTGLDPHTGEIKREFLPDAKNNSWFHQRCYRSKATERFLIPSVTGIEYIDIRSKHWNTNHWVRGACLSGILPANGMTYSTPHPCACFMESMLRGLSAMTTTESQKPVIETIPAQRLLKGPAYGDRTESPVSEDQWPVYRHDISRSGYTKAKVGEKLKLSWRTKLAGRITPPVIADGKVFVAAVDRHMVYALDANSGKAIWSYAAAGRVDSPPAIWKGRVLFGSADGHLYCLRASDGKLIWRFQAAPEDRQMVNDEQLESVWPVHGSVLIVNDTVYCLAGRNIFIDGGMSLTLLDPETGRLLSENKLDDMYESGKRLQYLSAGLTMVPANSDILSSDGKYIYLKTQRISLGGKRVFSDSGNKKNILNLNRGVPDEECTHIFSAAGFLDDDWHHRSYWVYGETATSGWGNWMKAGKRVPAGRIMSVTEDGRVFGFGRQPAFWAQAHVLEYQLFAARGKQYKEEDWRKTFKYIKNKEVNTTDFLQNSKLEIYKMTNTDFIWRNVNLPLLGRALLCADNIVFVAGPPDVLDETKLHGRFHKPEVIANLQKQQDAFEGKMGALLWAVSAEDGKKLAEYKLEAPPVFDGMAATEGKLYIVCQDGQVVCMKN